MSEDRYGGWIREHYTGARGELDSLIAGNPTENHRLEYKSGLLLNASGWGHEVARQVVSFANASGGLLVLGVDEATKQIAPVTERLTKQRLSDILGDQVQQPLDYRWLDMQEYDADGGFVYLLFVPCSDRPPHMVVGKGAHRGKYFWRSFEGCQVMLDQQVRDALGKRQRPDLRLKLVQAIHVQDSEYLSFGLQLALVNEGRSVARDVMVRAVLREHCGTSDPNRRDLCGEWSASPRPLEKQATVWCLERPIHPGLAVVLPYSRMVDSRNLRGQSPLYFVHMTTYCTGASPRMQIFECKAETDPRLWHDRTSTLALELEDDGYDEAAGLFGIESGGTLVT